MVAWSEGRSTPSSGVAGLLKPSRAALDGLAGGLTGGEPACSSRVFLCRASFSLNDSLSGSTLVGFSATLGGASEETEECAHRNFTCNMMLPTDNLISTVVMYMYVNVYIAVPITAQSVITYITRGYMYLMHNVGGCIVWVVYTHLALKLPDFLFSGSLSPGSARRRTVLEFGVRVLDCGNHSIGDYYTSLMASMYDCVQNVDKPFLH